MYQSPFVNSQLRAAAERVRQLFPIPDYLGRARRHEVVTGAVGRWLPHGTAWRILDFGSGPCDKSAPLALSGYEVSACDDLSDPWVLEGNHRAAILEFARRVGIDFFLIEPGREFPYRPEQFDLVMVNDVLEHLHHSPRDLLCRLLEWTRPGGFLLVTVPNAVNLRKRARVLAGLTNHPPYDYFFWSGQPWRGHMREYVLDDLRTLAQFLMVETVELHDIHWAAYSAFRHPLARHAYFGVTAALRVKGLRDSLLLVARKPPAWCRRKVEEARPIEHGASFEPYKKAPALV